MDVISKHMVGVLRSGEDHTDESTGAKVSFRDNSSLRPGDTIYDLVDVVEEGSIRADKGEQEIIVIDGRVYQRVMQPGDGVFDLNNTVEEGHHGDVGKAVSEIAERVAREIIPGIAEKIIREEIEKLKGMK